MKLNFTSILALGLTAALILPSISNAAMCTGNVDYLGIDASGAVVVRLANSTPIHLICSVTNQGIFTMTIPACKASYAAIMSARMVGKKITLYSNDPALTCSSLGDWKPVPSTYLCRDRRTNPRFQKIAHVSVSVIELDQTSVAKRFFSKLRN